MTSRIISRDFLIQVAAVVVFFAALWSGLFRQLSGEWSVNDQYSYGWFVPFFAALLFWLRWEDAPKAQIRNSKFEIRNGCAIVIIALLILLPLRVFELRNPD